MYIDIAPILSKYRGLARTINCDLFSKKNFDYLFNLYLEYISFGLEIVDSYDYFQKFLPFYYELIKNNIDCEIIISDKEPIKQFDKYSLEFLGIDIVNGYFESLLKDNNKINQSILNNNSLFDDKETCMGLFDFNNHNSLNNDCIWEHWYVYKVLI